MKKLLALALLGCSTAAADPIGYQLNLTVKEGTQALCDDRTFPTFGCNNSVGDIHTGSFTIDSSLLSLDGDNISGSFSNFLLQIGSVIWNQNNGFLHTGFDVRNGQLVGLEGSVFGSADVPFVDFFGTTFSAIDPVSTHLLGDLEVKQVPEPSPLLLFTLGFIALGFYTWKARN